MTTIARFWLISALPRLIAVVLLWLPLYGHLPYPYFIVLRWFLVLVMGYWIFTQYDRHLLSWRTLSLFSFLLIFILFNPVVPFHLDRDAWQTLDGLAGAAIVLSFWLLPHRSYRSGLPAGWIFGAVAAGSIGLILLFIVRMLAGLVLGYDAEDFTY